MSVQSRPVLRTALESLLIGPLVALVVVWGISPVSWGEVQTYFGAGPVAARGQWLDAQSRRVVWCNQARQQVVADVLAGRHSVGEAVAQFRTLDAEAKHHPVPGPGEPKAAEKERLCRQILGWARPLPGAGSQETEAFGRLQKEVKDYLAPPGRS
jgi:hypothetical protein